MKLIELEQIPISAKDFEVLLNYLGGRTSRVLRFLAGLAASEKPRGKTELSVVEKYVRSKSHRLIRTQEKKGIFPFPSDDYEFENGSKDFQEAYRKCWDAVLDFIAKPETQSRDHMRRALLAWLNLGGRVSFLNSHLVALLCEGGHATTAYELYSDVGTQVIFSDRVWAQLISIIQIKLVKMRADEKALQLNPEIIMIKEWYRQELRIYERLLWNGTPGRAYRWLMEYMERDGDMEDLDIECAGLIKSVFLNTASTDKTKAESCAKAFMKIRTTRALPSFSFLIDFLNAKYDKWDRFFGRYEEYEKEVTPVDILLSTTCKILELRPQNQVELKPLTIPSGTNLSMARIPGPPLHPSLSLK